MSNEKDIELIEEYEELVVLLRQLHNDTPILEEQHNSIKKAFKSAQKKLDSTINSSEEEMRKNAVLALDDFEKDCRKILNELIAGAKKEVADLMKQLKSERGKMESLLSDVAEAEIKMRGLIEQTRLKQRELVDGEKYSGIQLLENFSSHINKDLIVKKFRKDGTIWYDDFCMFVTEIKNGNVYGEIYLNGVYQNKGGGSISEDYVVYESPNKGRILLSRVVNPGFIPAGEIAPF